MSLSIGKQLKEARMKQGLTTEDIAHETRISDAHLRQLEEDDYSKFPNPTYARSFLGIYSEFLEVDAENVIEAMHGPKNGKSKGGEFDRDYLKPKITLAPPDTTIPIHKNLIVQKPGKPVLLLMLVF
ncbi:MAG: helix-turn-helix transcriptional regulator, partial [Verrucomicrobiota bacterium]